MNGSMTGETAGGIAYILKQGFNTLVALAAAKLLAFLAAHGFNDPAVADAINGVANAVTSLVGILATVGSSMVFACLGTLATRAISKAQADPQAPDPHVVTKATAAVLGQ